MQADQRVFRGRGRCSYDNRGPGSRDPNCHDHDHDCNHGCNHGCNRGDCCYSSYKHTVVGASSRMDNSHRMGMENYNKALCL